MTKLELRKYARFVLSSTIPALAETEFDVISSDLLIYHKDKCEKISEEDYQYLVSYASQVCHRLASQLRG